MVVSLGAVLIITLVAVSFGAGIYAAYVMRSEKSLYAPLLVKLAISIISVEIIFFFAHIQLTYLLGSTNFILWTGFKIISYFIVIIITMKFGFKVINIFFCSCLVVFAISGGYGILTEQYDLGPDLNFHCKLNRKPNIYLFFLESYNDLSVQRDVYGINTAELERYLDDNGFIIYDNILSNSWTTLLSYADTFGFKHHKDQDRGNNDTTTMVRTLIGGGKGNVLFKVLKENGYRNILLTNADPYYFHVKGLYLDETDLVYNLGTLLKPLLDLNIKLRKFEEFLQNGSKIIIDSGENYYSEGITSRVKTAIEHNRNSAPFFLCFKAGAEHTKRTGAYSPEAARQWVSGQYPALVEKANNSIVKITSYIIKRDPNALIILIGDHGPRRFSDICKEIKGNLPELKSVLSSYDITMEEFARDYFGVFLAVRMPKGEKRDISRGLVLSHVNLFRHIFAALNNDPKILESRVPSYSVINEMTVVKEGKIVNFP